MVRKWRKSDFLMGDGSRDHAAENRRRNQLAAERGLVNRYEQRRAIEHGMIAPLQHKTVRNPKTIAAQDARRAREELEDRVKPRSATADMRGDAYDWSTLFAQRHQAEYVPERAAALGVTRYTYTMAYLRAFYGAPYIEDDLRYTEVRYIGGSPALHYWFVSLNHYYTEAEYEQHYHLRLGY
jgi:hypothetical protein